MLEYMVINFEAGFAYFQGGLILLSGFTTIDYMQNQAIAGLYLPQSSKRDETSEHESQMNMETDVNLTKKKKIIFWVYLLAILIFAITVTILAAKSWQATSDFVGTDNYYYAYQVAQDWQLGYVIDLKVLNGTTNTACPAGYETAINYTWPGSSFGCYCNYSANLSFVLEGYCSPGLIQSGCLNLKNQAKFTVHNWANSSLICLKRSPVSFATQQRYNGGNKICGSSQSLVIMPSTDTCPYVNISFASFALQDHYATVTDSDNMLSPLYVSYNSTSPYSFYSYPFIKFAVSEYQFCQMDQDTGITTGHSDYLLLNSVRGCASVGNYTELNSQTQISFYQNNQKLQALTSIPGFPSPGNWEYLFGFTSLTGWTYSCRHNMNKKFAIPKAIQQFTFTYKGQYQGFLVGVTICLIILLLQVVLLALRRCVNNAVYPVGYRQKYLFNHFLLAVSRYVLDGCVKITLLGLFLGNTFIIYTNYNWFKGAINLRCADGNFTTQFQILNPFMQLYLSLFNYALAAVVICLATIIIDIIHFVYIWKNELTYYLVETIDKQMVKREDTEEQKIADGKELFQIKEFQEAPLVKDQNDQFRITMAQNIFAREESSEITKAKKKKKKKKISPLKKKEDTVANDIPNEESINILQDDFNPYDLDGDGVESFETKSPAKGPSKTKRRKR